MQLLEWREDLDPQSSGAACQLPSPSERRAKSGERVRLECRRELPQGGDPAGAIVYADVAARDPARRAKVDELRKLLRRPPVSTLFTAAGARAR
jgi:hypothetical protein